MRRRTRRGGAPAAGALAAILAGCAAAGGALAQQAPGGSRKLSPGGLLPSPGASGVAGRDDRRTDLSDVYADLLHSSDVHADLLHRLNDLFDESAWHWEEDFASWNWDEDFSPDINEIVDLWYDYVSLPEETD